jgi:hypothetical protein
LDQLQARKNKLGLWDPKNCDYSNLAKWSIKIPAAIVTFNEW